MSRRKLGVAVLAVAVMAAVPAGGAAGGTTSTTSPNIDILGGASFVPNRYIQDKLRFNKDRYLLKSGTTLKITGKSPGEPHTVSVVSKADLPKTVKGFDKCYEGGICGKLGMGHGFPEGEGPPANPLVNEGAAGFDKRGDSIVIGPPPNSKASIKLTGRKGSTLYLLCVIHPWMQARISVK